MQLPEKEKHKAAKTLKSQNGELIPDLTLVE
jgi:hypothetical protein